VLTEHPPIEEELRRLGASHARLKVSQHRILHQTWYRFINWRNQRLHSSTHLRRAPVALFVRQGGSRIFPDRYYPLIALDTHTKDH